MGAETFSDFIVSRFFIGLMEEGFKVFLIVLHEPRAKNRCFYPDVLFGRQCVKMGTSNFNLFSMTSIFTTKFSIFRSYHFRT